MHNYALAPEESEIIAYFKHKADQYDRVDEQIYWVLSDSLLWYYFNKNILAHLPPNFSFLDAGGGTGRWTLKLLETFPHAQGLIFDLSTAMTDQARKKAGPYADRLSIINGNLNDIHHTLSDSRYDLIFNFHNVLGFVADPHQIIKNLSALLHNEGYLVSLLPNKYHSLYFNLAINAVAEAENIMRLGKGRFTTNMPYMNLFTPASAKALYASTDLNIEHLTGFPNFIYPGHQETQLEGSTQCLETIIKDNFAALLSMEIAHLDAKDIAARGNNIFIAGRKKLNEDAIR